MKQENKEKILLNDYVKNYTIYELTSEDILKLLMKPYIISDIAESFGITTKEFNEIKKQKGLQNTILEDYIRDIDTILYYIDLKPRYVSNGIRKKIVEKFVQTSIIGIPKQDFYKKALLEINFSRDKVIYDLQEKKIDIDYRLEKLAIILPYIEKEVEKLLKAEKVLLLEDNNKQMYTQLCNEKKKGTLLHESDLTHAILFELSIIETISDPFIATLYNSTRSHIKYLRKKYGFSNIVNTKIKNYPELLIYSMEENGNRPEHASNYDLEKSINFILAQKDTNTNFMVKKENNDDITINIDGKEILYHVNFSQEKYSVNTTQQKKKSKGAFHNYKKENETKRLHGRIGEQLALQAEKRRLIALGLEDLVNDVKLVAQIEEEITFDGLGYDLISFNERREKICIEVKTSFGSKDKPFFISKKELMMMQGLKEEHNCQECLIYYILVDNFEVTIKSITSFDLNYLKLTPILYKVE